MESLSPQINPEKPKSNIWFSAIYLPIIILIWMAVLWAKQNFDVGHYSTVDGEYYIELAQKLIHNQPFVIGQLQNSSGRSFSPYPPGYPALLGLSIQLTGLNGSQSAIVLHGFLFLLLAFLWQRFASVFVLIPVFFTDSVLELATNSWSEFSFLFLVICLALLIAYQESREGVPSWKILVIMAFSSFLIRYAAVFIVIFFGLKWLLYQKSGKPDPKSWAKSILGFLFLFVVWSLGEWLWFGQVTGGDRYANGESNEQLLGQLGIEFLNQLLLFKDWTGSSPESFWMTTGFSLVLVFWAVFLKNRINPALEPVSGLAKNLGLLALSYLLFIIPLRWHFYFAEPFDFRLLGPGFILAWLSFSTWFFQQYKPRFSVLFLGLWIGLGIFSTLPKGKIFQRFQEKVWLEKR